MNTITTLDIQRDPAGFLRRVEAGETLVLLRDDCPLAEIKPVATERMEARPFGLCAGEFLVPDDFDAPLPDEVLKEFESP
jgi:antitoxin (DNA-binding transcriptional repressor) of toxin-antitoxin stability system